LFQALFIVPFALGCRASDGARPWLRLIALPAMWTACEWLRSLGFTGFTWGDLAISQYRNLPFVQLASVTGTWGLSYLLAMSNVAVAEVLAERTRFRSRVSHERRSDRPPTPSYEEVGQVVGARRPSPSPLRGEGWGEGDTNPLSTFVRLGVVALLALAVHVWGCRQMARPLAGEMFRVALVQGSFEQDQPLTDEYTRQVMSVYSGLSRAAARFRPDLVVWPETVIPGDLANDPQLQMQVSSLASRLGTHMLVGGSAYEFLKTRCRPYLLNGAFLFDPQGRLAGRYYKVHLVPFGEVVPLRGYLPLLERYRVRDEDYASGPEVRPIGDLGVMICFESIFPGISRELVRRNARLLVVMTNDGWFKRTSAPEQHLAFSVFRAVENRRWLVRNAATGISCLVDPRGRVTRRLGLWRRGVVQDKVRFLHGWTLYTWSGDWFAVVCVAASAVFLAGGLAGNRRSGGS